MSKASYLRYIQLTCFSQPRHNRRLYRQVETLEATRIVEIGLGNGQRALNLLALALRASDNKPIRYTGIDLFEARPNSKSFSLKQAHQLFQSHGHQVRLVPGEPASALSRCANDLRGTDLIVVGSEIAQASLQAAIHLLNRMLHKDSQVWIEQVSRYEVLGPADLRNLAVAKKAA